MLSFCTASNLLHCSVVHIGMCYYEYKYRVSKSLILKLILFFLNINCLPLSEKPLVEGFFLLPWTYGQVSKLKTTNILRRTHSKVAMLPELPIERARKFFHPALLSNPVNQ